MDRAPAAPARPAPGRSAAPASRPWHGAHRAPSGVDDPRRIPRAESLPPAAPPSRQPDGAVRQPASMPQTRALEAAHGDPGGGHAGSGYGMGSSKPRRGRSHIQGSYPGQTQNAPRRTRPCRRARATGRGGAQRARRSAPRERLQLRRGERVGPQRRRPIAAMRRPLLRLQRADGVDQPAAGAQHGRAAASSRSCSAANSATSRGRFSRATSGWRRMVPVALQGASSSTASSGAAGVQSPRRPARPRPASCSGPGSRAGGASGRRRARRP